MPVLRNHCFQRIVSAFVLATFVSLSLYPLTAAAQAKAALERAGMLPKQKDEGLVGNAQRYLRKLAGEQAAKPAPDAGARVGQLLHEIHEHLKAVAPDSAFPKNVTRKGKAKGKALPDADVDARVAGIRAKAGELKKLDAEIEQGFKDDEKRLKDAKAAQVILDRHQEALEQYRSRRAEFDRLGGKLELVAGAKAERAAALAELGAFMARYPNSKPHQYTDPNRLPFRVSTHKARAPFQSKEEFQASLFPVRYEDVKLAGPIPGGKILNPVALPYEPNAADLAESDDVQINQEIRDLAASLGNNPVKIYNYVRNNIAFIPSYGSIQGSVLTLQNKRGNAFDTASLLVALYRAAGTPARFVYGTIELPIERAKNWVGGVTAPEAVQSLLSQGGIPNILVTRGGKISAVRLEHCWVETYVDHIPSGGAVNRRPDTWVDVDASTKQNKFTAGMDIKSGVPLDGKTLLDQINQGATVNEAEGWVQNMNQANLQTQMAAYQTRVKAFVDSQKANATVGDLLGTEQIVPQNFSILLDTLPFKTVARAGSFQSLPDALRWRFKTNLYAADGVSDGSMPLLELNQNTAKLAGKKISLSFVPASQADQDLINSYMPKPHADGSPIQVSELPSSLPGYLLKMRAELRVEGAVVGQSVQTFGMGSSVMQSNQYFNPASGTWEGGDDNAILVGEYDAIGMALQGESALMLRKLHTKMFITNEILSEFLQNPSDKTSIAGLNKEDFAGDMMHAGVWGYFDQVDKSDSRIARLSANVVSYRLPSYGRFIRAIQPQYFFGIVRAVNFPGVAVDVDYLRYNSTDRDASQAAVARFVRQAGSAGSVAENMWPELMFQNAELAANDPGQPQGISAVKAIMVASVQGQKIYTLNQGNQVSHGAILQSLQISSDVKQEIADALAVGLEVTVHEKDVPMNGWAGSGYIILDPGNGSGAYKIAGGANGGEMATDVTAQVFGMLGYTSLVAGPATVALSATLNAISFAQTWLEGVLDCYAEELMNALVIILLAVAVAFLIGSLTGGAGAAPAFALVIAAAPATAAAAQEKECNLSCRKAAQWHFDAAGITDAEEVKKDYGFTRTKFFDICACEDGSMVIYGVKLCGKIKPGVPPTITHYRWK